MGLEELLSAGTSLGSLLPDAGQVKYNNPDDLIPDPKKKKRGYRR